MTVKSKSSKKIHFIHVPKDALTYELLSVDNDIRFNASGSPTRPSVSVQAYRLDGTARTQLPVNSQSGAQHYVVLKVATVSSVAVSATTSISNTNSLRQVVWARFYLIPKTVSPNSFSDSDVLATCPVQITHDGEDGSNGSFFSTVFVRAPQKPTTPTGGTYSSPYPTSKVTVGTEQRQWTDAPASGSDPIWISRAIFTPSHTTSSPAWSDPVMAVDSNDVEFIWSTSDTAPTLPTTHPFDAANPGSWSKDATDAAWMAVAVKSDGTWGDWQMSRVKGESAVSFLLDPGTVDLKKGSPVWMYVYVDINDGATPVRPDNFGITGVVTGGAVATGLTCTYLANHNGRAAIRLTYDGESSINVNKTVTATYKDVTYSRTLQIRTVADGQRGVNGKNGVWVPPPMEWTDYPSVNPDYYFMSGNLTADPVETRLDIVLIRSASGKVIPYRCIKSHYKSSSMVSPDNDAEHWAVCDAGVYKFVATELLWANIGQINFLSGQSFRIGDSNGMYGYFGVPVGPSGAIIYSGADNVSDASFVVYKNGHVVAKSADIEGRISASVLDLKVSTSASGSIPNGSLCFDVSTVKLPALATGYVRSIRIYNPLRTRTAPEVLTLIPENSTVRINTSRAFDMATSATKTMAEYGKNGDVYLELLGININNSTTWTVNVLAKST